MNKQDWTISITPKNPYKLNDANREVNEVKE